MIQCWVCLYKTKLIDALRCPRLDVSLPYWLITRLVNWKDYTHCSIILPTQTGDVEAQKFSGDLGIWLVPNVNPLPDTVYEIEADSYVFDRLCHMLDNGVPPTTWKQIVRTWYGVPADNCVSFVGSILGHDRKVCSTPKQLEHLLVSHHRGIVLTANTHRNQR
jgi:hypothetical protein